MIRLAQVEDVLDCRILAEKFFFARNTKGKFSGEFFEGQWVGFLTTGIGNILLRESAEFKIVEAIGYIVHPGGNGAECVSTMFWYVDDDSQGLAAGALFKAFLDGPAKDREIRISVLADERLIAVSDVLSQSGFSMYEMVYLKEAS
jgi:hypothetical protein